jgi:hypothetical protein
MQTSEPRAGGAGSSLAEAMAGLPAEFGFFAQRFDSDVAPRLSAREDERRAAARRQIIFFILGALVAVAGGAIGAYFGDISIGLFFGGIFGVMVGVWGSMPINKLAKETKLMLVEPVAEQFGLAFTPAPGQPAEIMELRRLGLVPSWDRAKYEDMLSGERAGAPFRFFEAHLEEKRTTTDSKGRTRTTWVTVFRGQCLAAHFHKPFNGVTKVFRDAGMFNMFLKGGRQEQRVRLEDPVFEKAFEVFSTDQIEARFILTPDFTERLVQLEKTFEGRKLRCAFEGGEMLVCVEGKNLLEPGSMHRPMTDVSRVREMLHDFAAIFLLIDSMVERRTPEQLRTEAT